MADATSSRRLCAETLRAFDRLCELERSTGADGELTPRQKHRRGLLEQRAKAADWLVPAPLASTVLELVATADRIDDPALAVVWSDHLPVAVLSVLERRGLRRRLADGDAFLTGLIVAGDAASR
jgi:hypothetical protein